MVPALTSESKWSPQTPLERCRHRQKGGDQEEIIVIGESCFFFLSLSSLLGLNRQSGLRAAGKPRWRQGLAKRWDERWDEAD